MARALVVEHIAEEGSGAFDDWLPAAGLDVDHHLVQRDGPPPVALHPAYDALVVMGGAMGLGDADSTHRWLHDDLALIRDAVAFGVPVLGVCLGAQLLAASLGGEVRTGRMGPELGLCRVHLAADDDPLLHDLPPIVNAVQWHWDEVLTLPPGARLLASSPRYPHQAFRVGDRAWGLQFHPEARPSMVRRWADEDADAVRAAGEDPATHVAEVEAAWPELERTWATVATRFAHVVQDAASAASKSARGSLGDVEA